MSGIKDFIKSLKTKAKFAKLSNGQKLGHSSTSEDYTPVDATTHNAPVSRTDVSSKAAEAALSRLNSQSVKKGNSMKAAVRRELDAEKYALKEAEALKDRFTPKVVSLDKPSTLSKVLFWCPSLLDQTTIGSRDEIDRKISENLMSELSNNPCESTVLILVRGIETSKLPTNVTASGTDAPSLSDIRLKRKENFIRILENLIQNPDNAKFRRLRASNQLVQDLLSINGAHEFFQVCKFTTQKLPVDNPKSVDASVIECDNSETETYLVISEEDAHNKEHLENMMSLLVTAEPIFPELYRDTRVYVVTGQTPTTLHREELPDEFFYHTRDDIRRLLDQQKQAVEESGMLLTKAMRERLKLQEIRIFRYAVIRIRLPNDILIQGTFHANDKFSEVRQWVSSCLSGEFVEFDLFAPPGTETAVKLKAPPTARIKLTDDNATLIDLGLVPSSLLTLVGLDDRSPIALHPDLLKSATSL